MTFQSPYRSSDQEAREVSRRVAEYRERHPSPVTARGLLIGAAWLAALVVIGFVLVGTGIIDPEFCHGTMNPASC